MFDLLDTRAGRRPGTFGISVVLHALAVVLLIATVGYAGLDKKVRTRLVSLVAPRPLEAEYKPPPPVKPRPVLPRPPVLETPPEIAKVIAPPAIVVERPAVIPAPAPVVKTNVFNAPAQAVATNTRQVHTGAFAENRTEAVVQTAALVQHPVFPGQQAEGRSREAGAVKATGFGAPATLVKPVAGMPSEVAVGNFFHGVPSGPTGRSTGGGGPVSVGAFGSGAGGGSAPVGNGSGGGTGRVATGGFGSAAVMAQAGPRVQRSEAAAITPVELLSKPAPAYTAEARGLKVEGVVVVQVVFLASGEIRVQGVARGLGHGLDESAVEAVRRIRFRPARQDGHAVDAAGEVEIRFQLAN